MLGCDVGNFEPMITTSLSRYFVVSLNKSLSNRFQDEISGFIGP